ncbi:MAG: hypothetical protein AABY07_04655, partial [Nanoarchaeota archaeon]
FWTKLAQNNDSWIRSHDNCSLLFLRLDNKFLLARLLCSCKNLIYYTVTYFGPTPGLPSYYRIILQGCPDQYGNAPLIQMDGSTNQLYVKINYETIEDIGGNMIFVGNQLQQIKWTVNVDVIPGYANLDLAEGDQELIYLIDEPEGLLGLNAALDVTPVNSATCGTQYSVDLAYSLLYS